jgi:hypothetical protein
MTIVQENVVVSTGTTSGQPKDAVWPVTTGFFDHSHPVWVAPDRAFT